MLNRILGNRKSKHDAEAVALAGNALKPDLIPYLTHIDDTTIVTKNGELMQFIKITGFKNEMVGRKELELRDLIRSAIKSNIQSDDFALWFHTARVKKSLDPGGVFPPGFAADLNEAWNERHGWDAKYVNQLYVTVIYNGKKISITDPKDFLNSFFPSRVKKLHTKYIMKNREILSKAVDGMIEVLKDYGATKLGIYKARGDYYSEPIQFFYKVLNLVDRPVLLPLMGIDEYLSQHYVAFGFDSMEVIGSDFKRFGAVLTIKEYHELSTRTLDKFLQLDQEFIVTQTLDFINYKLAVKEFKRQKYIMNVSKSEDFSKAVGIEEMDIKDEATKTDFGESQMTIFIIGETLEKLNENVAEMVRALSKVGIVATRQDLRLEECFWSRLPGNFPFLTRQRPISVNKIGGFASLYNFPAGSQYDSFWGPAVSVFHTAKNTPYFFSFHYGHNGHSLILGQKNSGKTVMLNFLLSESRKYNNKLFFFDQEQGSKVFIKAIGGHYIDLDPKVASKAYAFNPLLLPENPENRLFLAKWLMYLAVATGKPISNVEKAIIVKVVDEVFKLPNQNRRLSYIAQYFGQNVPGSLAERMSIWYGNGMYAHLFDNERADLLPFNEAVYGFEMSHVIKDKITHGPILSYLMHRIEHALDGSPAIIVLDEAWNLVNNPIFAPELPAWLDRIQNNNAIVIFATENIADTAVSRITNEIVKRIATQIFLPNAEAEKFTKAYTETWGLSEQEFTLLKEIPKREAKFLLKRGGETVVAKLDLFGMKELNVLSGSVKTVTIMEEIIAKKGENPNDWLPEFYERV